MHEFSNSKACWDMVGLSTCLYSLAIVRHAAGIWLGFPYLFIQEFSHSKACWDMVGFPLPVYTGVYP